VVHTDDASAGGCYRRNQSDVTVLGLFPAAEDHVRWHDTQPYRPGGWTSVIDEAGDAEKRLRQAAPACGDD
jgi:hypothetical protein